MANGKWQMANGKSQIADLKSYLWWWGLRLRLVESFAGGLWGGIVGLGLGLGLSLAARVWPLLPPRQLIGLAGFLTLTGVMAGLCIVWLRPRSPFRLARIFDRRFELAERLTTALEITSGRLRTTPALAAAQLADALDAAQRVDLRARLPMRAPRPHVLACAALTLLLALALWLPNPQEKVLLQRAAVKSAIEEEIAALESAREQIAATEGLSAAEREAILEALDEALAQLRESKATAPEEALAALSEAEQALAKMQDPGAQTIRQGLERAAGQMADSDLTRGIAEALARGDYETAAQALASFAGNKGEALTRAEELELARELAEAAKALEGSAPELAEQLSQAAQAIERGDITEAREAIRSAAQQMGAAGERVEGQAAVEGALSQLQEGREQIAQAGGAEAQSGQGGQQAGAGQQTQAGHSEDAGSAAPYDELYVPYRLGEQGAEIGLGREGEEGVVVGESPFPRKEGVSTVPYREVYAEYAAQAGAALEGSYIPLGLKQYVRDYFSSLEP